MKYSEYSKKCLHYYDASVPVLLKQYINACRNGVFCDLGCGDGALINRLGLEGYFDTTAQVVAVDFSKERIDVAKRLNPGVEFFLDDACNIKGLKDETVDFLVSTQVIEHVDSDERMLLEIKRVLKPSGIAYLSTVFKKRYAWYFYRNQGRWVLDPTHLREYTEDRQLLDTVNKAGFAVLESTKSMFWFPVLDFFLKRLGAERDIYKNKILKILRRTQVPIPGYYLWELVVRKV